MAAGIVIHPGGKLERRDFDGLESMQAGVGGYIQLIKIDAGTVLWVNEEGYLDNLPVNDVATVLVQEYSPYTWLPPGGIRGSAVLLGLDAETGDNTDVGAAWFGELQTL